MPKIRIREKDYTGGNSAEENNNIIFLVDSKADETPVLLEKAGAGADYERADEIELILGQGGKVLVGNSYTNCADYLKDRNQFDVKFLLVDEAADTTALESALGIASYRRDCVVVYGKSKSTWSEEETTLLDKEVWGTSETDKTSFLSEETGTYGKYCLAYYGNGLVDSTSTAFLPSVAYVLAYLKAKNDGNAEWLATAGSKRGAIPVELSVGFLKESDIDDMQSREGGEDGSHSINPIVKMNPWGVRIWGARTAMKIEAGEELGASHFANIRILLCDLKKRLYKAARTYQFEQNNDVLWVNFTSSVNELLEEMKQSYGIAGYKWVRGESDERAKLKATLRLIPIEPVEDFDLTIDLVDSLEVAE